MIDGPASARVARADEPAEPIARLPWSICAVVHDDWLVFLDLARNRYQALAIPSPANSRGSSPTNAAQAIPADKRTLLARQGLAATPTRARQPSSIQGRSKASCRDFHQMIIAWLWAGRIVRRGALLNAFCFLSEAKARLGANEPDIDAGRRVRERFAAARIWAPAPYVCLFDSLALMRFLLANNVRADLVFGVRGRPFAAHCWVEVDGVILDDGGEACQSFAEIVRV